MNFGELVEKVANDFDQLPKKTVKEIIKKVFDEIKTTVLEKDEEVKIVKFGKFLPKVQKSREVKFKDKTYITPSKKIIKFKHSNFI